MPDSLWARDSPSPGMSVRSVVDSASLSVVGLVEVVAHIPRIYKEFRKLIGAARDARPDLAILTDSPDFHLRLAGKLKRQGIPVVYLIAPQVWAWRQGRIPGMRRVIDGLDVGDNGRFLTYDGKELPW